MVQRPRKGVCVGVIDMGPVKKVNLSDAIFNRILDMVREGHLQPNEKIMSERELCETFDASRTSVREALKGLASMGIIVKRRDGNYVCDNLTNIIARPIDILLRSNVFDLDHVFEARLAVESQIVRLAAQKATDADLRALEECLYIEAQETEDAVMRKSVDFHVLIAQCTKNPILQEMYMVIYRILEGMRGNERSLRQVRESQKAHRAIFRAIRQHNPDRAEQALREHLSSLKSSIE